MTKPLVLIILDGWGLAPPGPGNAISLAQLTTIPNLWNSYPHTELEASGVAVGLPNGEDGNTETGHLNIGAGRVVYQALPRINMAISDGSFYQNAAFSQAITYATQHHSNIHLLGLLSDSGVHASREHLYALLTLLKERGGQIPVYLHLFTDGRDSPPNSAKRFLAEVEAKCTAMGIGKIATILGRYYAMDRDYRWERTEKAYRALTEAVEARAPSPASAIDASYVAGRTDEFVEPTVILDASGNPLPRITNHDAVIFYNFRIDRPRQLTRAFVLPDFEDRKMPVAFDPYAVKYFHKHVVAEDSRNTPFTRRVTIPNVFFVTMTEYERSLPCVTAFPPEKIPTPLASVFAGLNLRQLHTTETEKERFVTYYFNGLREEPFAGEDRLIVPSPKVATYDLLPQMSAEDLTGHILDRLALDVYSFVVINLPNPDMVAHTGNILAAVRACETVDACVAKIVEKVLSLSGSCIVTGDHGNVEEMLGPNGEVDTEHSTNSVPFIMIDKELAQHPQTLPKGKLSDIAPTILAWRNMPIPAAMTGKNLLADLPR